MSPTVTVDAWERALPLVRVLGREVDVRVPKSAEPTLPLDLQVRRSNVPWSVHKGAFTVYREDVPGEHVQIREYADHWEVELDRYNPHYRPARHVAVDTPAYTREAVAHPVQTTLGLLLFGPVRSVQFVDQVATTAVEGALAMLDRGIEFGRRERGLLWGREERETDAETSDS